MTANERKGDEELQRYRDSVLERELDEATMRLGDEVASMVKKSKLLQIHSDLLWQQGLDRLSGELATAIKSQNTLMVSSLRSVDEKQQGFNEALMGVGHEVSALASSEAGRREELRELRTMVESVARLLDSLSVEFIDREVRLPFYQFVARLYGSASDSNGSEAAGCEELKDEMAIFLGNEGIGLVAPSEGEGFDPRLHCVVERREAQDPALAGKVACCFSPGLRSSDRVLQAARVAVYTVSKDAGNKAA